MYFYFIIFAFKVISSEVMLDTSTGLVQGVNSLKKDVDAFLGIPYAEPPVGELRFAKPMPKNKWSGVYNASKLPRPCIQSTIHPYYYMPDVTDMSEDCLYLNIWAPKSKPMNGMRPIMFFIHHGTFVTGSSNLKTYEGSNLASRGDVVVVTINYRLGTLGFFLAYTKDAEGSMGMYDQIMAIKWVKQNARLFHGDPENIVLMGSSAGSLAVSAHLLSPLSKNLFKRAILLSGSLINPLYADNTRLYKTSVLSAVLVNCSNETVSLKSDPQAVLKCMKSKPQGDFAIAEENILKTNPVSFYPRVNGQFLPEKLADSVRKGKFRNDVELLVGISEQEGSMMMLVGLHDYFGYYGHNADHMNKIRFITLGRGAALVAGLHNPSEIIKFYLTQVTNKTSIGYTKMLSNIIGDFSVACPTVFLADFISRKGNTVHFYKFEYRSPSTPMADWVGATHLDELQYVFGNPYHQNFTSDEIELSHRLIDRWSAFAKNGNPSIPGHIPWFPYSYSKPVYMNFGQEEETIRFKPNNRCEIWRKLFDSEIESETEIKSPLFLQSNLINAAEIYSSQFFYIFSLTVCIYVACLRSL